MSTNTANVLRTLVFGWHKKFPDVLEEVSDKLRIGRSGRSKADIEWVRDFVNDGRRRPVLKTNGLTVIFENVMYNILTENLSMNKVCLRWVPRLLNDNEKASGSRHHGRLSCVLTEKVTDQTPKPHHNNGWKMALLEQDGVQTTVYGLEISTVTTTEESMDA